MDDRSGRKHERFRVFLSVSFGTAEDFVREYAENLSKGGLFIRGAHEVELLSDYSIHIALPGFEPFQIRAQAVHILDPATAELAGRKPGAGFSITEAPADFHDALSAYLQRLGRRRDAVVLVDEPIGQALVEAAGYQVRPLPPAGELVAEVARSDVPVLGVIVSRGRAAGYREAAAAAGEDDLVFECDSYEDLEAVLVELDDRL